MSSNPVRYRYVDVNKAKKHPYTDGFPCQTIKLQVSKCKCPACSLFWVWVLIFLLHCILEDAYLLTQGVVTVSKLFALSVSLQNQGIAINSTLFFAFFFVNKVVYFCY